MREQPGNDGLVSYAGAPAAKVLERLRSTRRFSTRKRYRFVVRKQTVRSGACSDPRDSHLKRQESTDEPYRTPARKLVTQFKVASTAATAQPIFESIKEHVPKPFVVLTRDRYSKKVYYFRPRALRPPTAGRKPWNFLHRM